MQGSPSRPSSPGSPGRLSALAAAASLSILVDNQGAQYQCRGAGLSEAKELSALVGVDLSARTQLLQLVPCMRYATVSDDPCVCEGVHAACTRQSKPLHLVLSVPHKAALGELLAEAAQLQGPGGRGWHAVKKLTVEAACLQDCSCDWAHLLGAAAPGLEEIMIEGPVTLPPAVLTSLTQCPALTTLRLGKGVVLPPDAAYKLAVLPRVAPRLVRVEVNEAAQLAVVSALSPQLTHLDHWVDVGEDSSVLALCTQLKELRVRRLHGAWVRVLVGLPNLTSVEAEEVVGLRENLSDRAVGWALSLKLVDAATLSRLPLARIARFRLRTLVVVVGVPADSVGAGGPGRRRRCCVDEAAVTGGAVHAAATMLARLKQRQFSQDLLNIELRLPNSRSSKGGGEEQQQEHGDGQPPSPASASLLATCVRAALAGLAPLASAPPTLTGLRIALQGIPIPEFDAPDMEALAGGGLGERLQQLQLSPNAPLSIGFWEVLNRAFPALHTLHLNGCHLSFSALELGVAVAACPRPMTVRVGLLCSEAVGAAARAARDTVQVLAPHAQARIEIR